MICPIWQILQFATLKCSYHKMDFISLEFKQVKKLSLLIEPQRLPRSIHCASFVSIPRIRKPNEIVLEKRATVVKSADAYAPATTITPSYTKGMSSTSFRFIYLSHFFTLGPILFQLRTNTIQHILHETATRFLMGRLEYR